MKSFHLLGLILFAIIYLEYHLFEAALLVLGGHGMHARYQLDIAFLKRKQRSQSFQKGNARKTDDDYCLGSRYAPNCVIFS